MNTYDTLYLIYAAAGVTAVFWAARVLQQQGRALLIHAYRGNATIRTAAVELQVANFILANLAVLALVLGLGLPANPEGQFEGLGLKLAAVLFAIAWTFRHCHGRFKERQRIAELNMPPLVLP